MTNVTTLSVISDTLPPKVIEEYRWKMHKGPYVRPSIMRTGHLFNTVIMLWHHFMPEDAWLYPHKRWTFNFSDDYVRISIRIMLSEIVTRDDLTTFQLHCLERMVQYLNSKSERITWTKKLSSTAFEL